jgi:peptide/nickel transport system ATP-binding protein
VQPTLCRDEVPPLRELEPGHLVTCHWAEQIKAGEIQPKEIEAVFVEADGGARAWEPPPV